MKRTVAIVLGMVLAINATFLAALIVLRRKYPSVGDEHSDELSLSAIGTGMNFSSVAQQFRGGSLRAVMGGVRLDLQQVALHPEGARLEVDAMMSGIDILVGDDWATTVEQQRTSNANVIVEVNDRDTTSPTLAIVTRATMSSIRITNTE